MAGTARTRNRARYAQSLLVSLFGLLFLCQIAVSQKPNNPKIAKLGEQLFRDNRFSTPAGDLPASCSNCHLLNEDPQGIRAFADFFNRSWVSSRMQDIRRLHPRNSPTLFDVGELPVLHYDGEFSSLENLVKGTLAGRPMGWLSGEENAGFDQAREVALKYYRPQFRDAFGVDLDSVNASRTMDMIATAIADFCRTLKSPRNSPYDRFIGVNGLATKSPSELSASLRSADLKLTENFDAAALRGMRVFFGSEANCVSCHAPPRFTDDSFHNKGTSQREYDRIHGEGSFASIAIPKPEAAKRPMQVFREAPSAYKPADVDLGYWNFVDLKKSPMRRSRETDDQFLERMIATFKTPTLRNLKYSFPYFHDGSIVSLEEVIDEMARLSGMARNGKLRSADDEFVKVRIREEDKAPLLAFLNSLNDDLTSMLKSR